MRFGYERPEFRQGEIGPTRDPAGANVADEEAANSSRTVSRPKHARLNEWRALANYTTMLLPLIGPTMPRS